MNWSLRLVTAPAAEPCLPADLSIHSRISSSEAEASALESKLAAARIECESYTRRQLIEATWELRLDRFPGDGDEGVVLDGAAIVLPKPPLRTLTSVKYLDPDSVEQTLASSAYVVEPPAGEGTERARISLATGESWPATSSQSGAVRVRFVAGYGSAGSSVPQNFRQGILQRAASLYEDREDRALAASLTAAERLWNSGDGRAWAF